MCWATYYQTNHLPRHKLLPGYNILFNYDPFGLKSRNLLSHLPKIPLNQIVINQPYAELNPILQKGLTNMEISSNLIKTNNRSQELEVFEARSPPNVNKPNRVRYHFLDVDPCTYSGSLLNYSLLATEEEALISFLFPLQEISNNVPYLSQVNHQFKNEVMIRWLLHQVMSVANMNYRAIRPLLSWIDNDNILLCIHSKESKSECTHMVRFISQLLPCSKCSNIRLLNWTKTIIGKNQTKTQVPTTLEGDLSCPYCSSETLNYFPLWNGPLSLPSLWEEALNRFDFPNVKKNEATLRQCINSDAKEFKPFGVDLARISDKYTAKEFAELRDQLWNLSLIHISEPTRQAEISYAVFCLKKKNYNV
eukprot:TRINITY_DN2295_c0_g1_i6.p1 TRINITY_DN2295_c0_g1~~TRINITY_DN2295_c0_g1_i6.p1  ORF type:complete len:364 (+),score=38.30 TRINITY_DN2295_c0_g1_i6:196-1287(+)